MIEEARFVRLAGFIRKVVLSMLGPCAKEQHVGDYPALTHSTFVSRFTVLPLSSSSSSSSISLLMGRRRYDPSTGTAVR